MPVTRADLDRWLTELTGDPIHSAGPITPNRMGWWDLFPRVSQADFNPAIAGMHDNFIWWTVHADAAFDAENVLTRPMLLHWKGERVSMQLNAARCGLTLRLVSTERYDAAGLAVLSPNANDRTTDLSRLLDAFDALRQMRCVAIEDAGITQSEGWTSVAETQEHPNQNAIFWHSQGHDSFDGLGMLSRTMHLYWRGSARALAQPLKKAGFQVTIPTDKSTSIQIASSHTPPDGIATIEEARRWERPLRPASLQTPHAGPLQIVAHSSNVSAPDHAPGKFVEDLWPAPSEDRIFYRLRYSDFNAVDPLQFQERPKPPLPGNGAPVTMRWLSDGRALIAWIDYGAADDLKLVVSSWAEDGVTELFRQFNTHPGRHSQIDVDAAAEHIVIARPRGVAVRQVGPPGSTGRTNNPRVKVRRKRPRSPNPWDELKVISNGTDEGYPIVAISRNGQTLLCSAEGSMMMRAFDRDRGEALWSMNPMENHRGPRGTNQLGTTRHGWGYILTRRHRSTPTGGEDTYHTVLFDVRTGDRAMPDLETSLRGACALDVHPTLPLVVAGHPDGTIQMLNLTGTILDTCPAFQHGGVSVVRCGQRQIYAGSSRGELCTLRWNAPQ